MKKRTTRTYTIDDKLYEKFEKIIKEKSINKSRLIENFIEDFVKKHT
jgi:metal-responsive CopG/Arc/MetJ family transcriptional regulator